HTRLVSDWSSDVCSSDLARRRNFGRSRAHHNFRWNDPAHRVIERVIRGKFATQYWSARDRRLVKTRDELERSAPVGTADPSPLSRPERLDKLGQLGGVRTAYIIGGRPRGNPRFVGPMSRRCPAPVGVVVAVGVRQLDRRILEVKTQIARLARGQQAVYK